MIQNQKSMNIILFDGLCNLCSSTVNILIKHDTKDQLFFASQQGNTGRNLMDKYNIKDDLKSVILIKVDIVFYKSDAIIEIANLITGWPSVFKYGSLFPKRFRNWVYNMIANNRYRIFGKKDQCEIFDKKHQSKFLV
jgi:predicted DCC family thiol-disulfide oxidoreductase YuxK